MFISKLVRVLDIFFYEIFVKQLVKLENDNGKMWFFIFFLVLDKKLEIEINCCNGLLFICNFMNNWIF